MRLFIAATAVTLTLAACGSPTEEKAASPAGEPSAAATTASATGAKPAAFAQCAACHAVEPGKHGVGPSLAGVFGTKSGAVTGYTFSDAMKSANLTWDEPTLDAYLANPMKLVPGTKMTFAGMGDPAKRKDVIDYLKALK